MARETVALGDGVWIAYHHDRSGVYIFSHEIDALRYAVENQTAVKKVIFGKEILEE